jgi:hypothetical protein
MAGHKGGAPGTDEAVTRGSEANALGTQQQPSSLELASSATRPEQIDTCECSVWEIMGTPEFERGLKDARAGAPFDWRVDDPTWSYERGRLFAHVAPLDMRLWIGRGRQLNPKAVALFQAALKRSLIT